jgi:hypothetical protein
MKAMETCLNSASKFFMLARDWAQKIIANHEHSLYCNKKQKLLLNQYIIHSAYVTKTHSFFKYVTSNRNYC